MRNRSEFAARQPSLPLATIGGSVLCRVGLPNLSLNNAVRRHSGEHHRLGNLQM
jgi:hypothetical protein